MFTQPEAFALQICKEAAFNLFGPDTNDASIQIQKTKKEFSGDLTLVVFPLVRYSGKSPEETAEMMGDFLKSKHAELTGYNVVKGFLNLCFSDSFWRMCLAEIMGEQHFGTVDPGTKPTVMVEYSSPNTNKPLHLGHLRNNFLGYSVAQILEAAGHKVIKVQIINDRGIHICKSMVAWQKFGKGETPESSGMKGDKLVGKYYVAFDKQYKAEVAELTSGGKSEEEAKETAPILKEAREILRKWESGDIETIALWKTMNNWVYKGFEKTYNAMGVTFDKLYYESDTYLIGRDEVLNGVEKGVFQQREDGSVWCDLTANGLDEKLLLRKDGTAVYMTQDIGTAILRFKENPGLQSQIYTVGNEQEYHFKVLFLVLEKLGYPGSEQNHHLSYGMVELPEGKMKSREGTVVDADDLMEEMAQTAAEIAAEQGKLEGMSAEEKADLFHVIGMGALKYFLLKVDPKKNMMFNPAESVDFNGNTGPFIQYVYVRTQAVLRKSEEDLNPSIEIEGTLNAHEKSLIAKICDFPQTVSDAATGYNPALVANYVYDLAKEFNSFYQSSSILKEPDVELRKLRLALTHRTGAVIKSAMGLLGIEVPLRM